MTDDDISYFYINYFFKEYFCVGLKNALFSRFANSFFKSEYFSELLLANSFKKMEYTRPNTTYDLRRGGVRDDTMIGRNQHQEMRYEIYNKNE